MISTKAEMFDFLQRHRNHKWSGQPGSAASPGARGPGGPRLSCLTCTQTKLVSRIKPQKKKKTSFIRIKIILEYRKHRKLSKENIMNGANDLTNTIIYKEARKTNVMISY